MAASAASIATAEESSFKALPTRDNHFNGFIRRTCVCGNKDQCREIWKFWCEPIDETGTCRDRSKAGYIDIPVYNVTATTPLMDFKNKKRQVYFAHLLPRGLQEGLQDAALSRNSLTTRQYVALHHFPTQYLRPDGKGLTSNVVSKDEAKSLGLANSDLFVSGGQYAKMHKHTGKYILPPCRKWNDILSEFKEKGGGTLLPDKKVNSRTLPSGRAMTRLTNRIKKNPEAFAIEYEKMEKNMIEL